MKYLKKFETESEYKAFLVSSEFINPNVSLVAGEVKYAPILGVFIQHIDGTLYTTDEWTANAFSSDVANGVAVAAPEASFVIAKSSLGDMYWSSDTSTLVEGVFTTEDSTTAKTDYAGAANTALIAATDTSKAAYSCANYAFPNGQKGYLPALGEWAVAYNNKTAINAAMTLIGGTSLGSKYYWSSTQHSATYAWVLYWMSGDTYRYNKHTSIDTVRAFSALTL